jgi:uncharacterized protein with GYD domain
LDTRYTGFLLYKKFKFNRQTPISGSMGFSACASAETGLALTTSGQGEPKMPSYIRLLRFSEQATKDLKQFRDRIAAAKKAYRDGGAELKQVFMVVGQYDLVAVVQAPNDETLAKIALAQSMLGVFRSTETMRAFTEEEIVNLVATLP